MISHLALFFRSPSSTPHRFSRRIGQQLAALALVLTSSLPALAQVPAPLDKAYPGTLVLNVDATNLSQQIFQVRETIPVKPGKMTLLYPQWLPGNHAPSNPLVQLAGLMLSANGKRVDWVRDETDMFAFHITVPAGATTLEAQFQYLSPLEGDQGRTTMTNEIVGVQWNAMLLYPAGFAASRVTFQPNVTLPDGWQFGGALELDKRLGNVVRFKPVDLVNLIDSPLFAGRYFKRFDLDPGAKIAVHLNVVADNAESLAATPEQLAIHRALIQQAYKLYGSHHYDHYDFLLSLSDEFSGIGLEHHQSSENGVKPGYFTDWAKSTSQAGRDLLAHEYTHSWNGKFRRPAGQNVANFNQPLHNSLLWVYEGQTQYWGYVLAARSGLMSVAQVQEAIAATAARYDSVQGRSWRAMQDTTNDPIINRRKPLGWVNWQRAEDYYSEGQLIWLDTDTKIRELSGDKRSLNDFAHSFFAVHDGSHAPAHYSFEDVVQALNAVQPYDWASFLRSRLDGHGPGAPLDGLARAGWKLVYTEQMSDYLKGAEEHTKSHDFSYSLGLTLDKDAHIRNLIWDSPAFKAGLSAGPTVLAVNGKAYKPERLKAAITAAKNGAPIDLLIKKGETLRTVRIDYRGGLRYPRLERIAGTPDRLGAILQALN
jgi:predicted metalloprotease with PDZ domain